MKKKLQPPRLADRLLSWYCNPDLLDEIQGDLHELYQRRAEKLGVTKAKVRYWLNVLMFCQPAFLGKRKYHTTNHTVMFKNYCKVAYRNMLKHRLYAAINIAGLMVSFAFCALIWLYVKDELSFDRSYVQADRIYRAWVKEDYGPDEQFFNTYTPIPLGPALQNSFSEIAAAVRIGDFTTQIKKGEDTQSENVLYVDAAFFKVFDAQVLRGQVALHNMQDLILTQSYAHKYFGEQDPVGKTLTIRVGDAFQEYTVAGVVADPPANVSQQYNMLISFENSKYFTSERARESWYNVSVETYVLLQDKTSGPEVEAKLPSMVEQVLGEKFKPGEYIVGLQPLTDIHLNASIPQGRVAVSDWKYVYILSGIALLILVVACINFVTLAVGRSLSRAKEVGVRKVVGAERQQLMSQFWSEALLTTLIATLLGVLLVMLLLPVFNQLAGKSLSLALSLSNLLFMISLVLLMGFLAGVYPALLLSGFSPLLALRGRISMGYSRETLRKAMVAFQFVLAAILIIGTLIMKQQLNYLQDKNLGFDREQIVVVPQNLESRLNNGIEKVLNESHQKKQIVEEALARIPEVKEVTASLFTFGQAGWIEVGYTTPDDQYREFGMNVVDPDFVKTYGLQVVEGRNFVEESGGDARSAVLVNETFAQAFNLDDPVGSTLPPPFQEYQVIGVLQDFHHQSLHTAVQPMLLVINPEGIFNNIENINFEDSPAPKLSIKVKSKALPQTMAQIQDVWQEVAPGQPFDFSFVDQSIEAQYRQEQRLGTILSITTALGIFISCLGLFGLVTLSMSRKTKEIGIRKVLGATVWQVVSLSYKEFLGLIAIAFVIAMPVSYWMMNRWLADFAYRITLQLPVFLWAGVILAVVAGLTIAYQSMKAATSNPVNSLRDE